MCDRIPFRGRGPELADAEGGMTVSARHTEIDADEAVGLAGSVRHGR